MNTFDLVLSSMLHIEPTSHANILSFTLLTLGRIAPIVAWAPFLGAKMPGATKIGLALVLSFLFLPFTMETASGTTAFEAHFIFLFAKEVLLGFILSFLITLPFHIVGSTGVIIDFMRGSSSLMVQDPTMQTQVSPIGLMLNAVLMVLFYTIGAPFIIFNGLLDSFTVIPVDHFLPPDFFAYSKPLWLMIASIGTKVLALAIQLGAPSILAILMAEVFLGVANRLAPQVQIAFLGMSLKSLLGLTLLWSAWFFVIQQSEKESLNWINELIKVVKSF